MLRWDHGHGVADPKMSVILNREKLDALSEKDVSFNYLSYLFSNQCIGVHIKVVHIVGCLGPLQG